MQQIHHYQLDHGQCAHYTSTRHAVLTVVAGSMWLTREGDSMDHWLVAGETIELAARQRFCLSAEGAAVEMQIRSEVSRSYVVASNKALNTGTSASLVAWLLRAGATAPTWITRQFTKRRLSPWS